MRKGKLTRMMYHDFGRIGGCPGTRYTKSRGAPMLSREGSVASLIGYVTSEGESTPSTSAVPSNDALGAIVYRGSVCLISGATLLMW